MRNLAWSVGEIFVVYSKRKKEFRKETCGYMHSRLCLGKLIVQVRYIFRMTSLELFNHIIA